MAVDPVFGTAMNTNRLDSENNIHKLSFAHLVTELCIQLFDAQLLKPDAASVSHISSGGWR